MGDIKKWCYKEMNLKQLKEKLEPWIVGLIQEELKKQEAPRTQGLFAPIYNDEEMKQVLKNAGKSLDFFKKMRTLYQGTIDSGNIGYIMHDKNHVKV